VIHSYPWTGLYQPSSLFHLRAEDVSQENESAALYQSDATEVDSGKDSLVSDLTSSGSSLTVITYNDS